jgi:ubiquitin C-terminal hydrolase
VSTRMHMSSWYFYLTWSEIFQIKLQHSCGDICHSLRLQQVSQILSQLHKCRSKVQCDACKITRTQTKQNIILEIYFNANSTIGVPDMVNVVTTSKISDYHCHQCRVKGQATITERIFGNTSTLFVHITKTPTCNGSVRIENTHLTVNRRIYRLTGIVQYLSHGHYIAYIKSLKQPCLWFRVSDTQVEVVSSAKVLTIPPFILT